MHILSPLRLPLLAAALAAAFPVLAQDSTPAAPTADAAPPAAQQKMQKVEVRGTADSYDPRRDDTATKIVVGQEEIAKYGDTNVADVLKRVPGITVNSPNGRGAEIRMRGLGAGYTQILINGERAPNGFTLDSLSPDVIERIEVLRAASAEFSTQSVAGTVNIVLKKAVRAGQREFKLGARTGGGSVARRRTCSCRTSWARCRIRLPAASWPSNSTAAVSATRKASTLPAHRRWCSTPMAANRAG